MTEPEIVFRGATVSKRTVERVWAAAALIADAIQPYYRSREAPKKIIEKFLHFTLLVHLLIYSFFL